MFFHLSALSVFLAVAFCTLFLYVLHSLHTHLSTPPVLIYYRARLFSLAARFLPDTIVNRLSHYTPLESYSFADQAEAGMSSGNFDLEANIGEGSGEGRLGLDEAGVEEIRRIM